MDTDQAQVLRRLILEQQVAALGTLHNGEPAVSMVPYVILPETGDIVVHVSRLATHTQDMLSHPTVSVLVIAERADGVPPQAVPRATLNGRAEPCPAESPAYAGARSAYLGRFPDSEPLFGFADFSLFCIAPRSVRFVGGFAEAWSLRTRQYRELIGART